MTYASFHLWILSAVLAMARIGAAFAICPALADTMIPGVARRAATFAFAVLALPAIHATIPPGEPDLWLFALAAFREALIGFLIGFFGAIPFWVAENVGNFIDNQRGATMGEVYSPLSGTQVSTTGIFFTQIVSTVFFVGGAVFLFLGALYKSYAVWPVFVPGSVPSLDFAPNAPLQVLGTLDGMLRTTVIIAAPVIIVMFLATIGLGFVNRTAPQLNVFFLSMPIKSAIGVALLIVYLPFIMDMLMYTRDTAILDPARALLGG
ncbi:MAG: type III secretion system export apparatus subunit SctT [Kiritimatiellae bacterium]|nr:type III secretion system export apparatus subunit SctT [Kiritimatiellia bacterium]MBR4252010.1 type III secretion system export apparatus subunit SctT [Kiritimatiellia bacterium]